MLYRKKVSTAGRQLFPSEKIGFGSQLRFSHAVVIDEHNDVSTICLHGTLSTSVFPPAMTSLDGIHQRQLWKANDQKKIFWPKLGLCTITVYAMCSSALQAHEKQVIAEKEKKEESVRRKELLLCSNENNANIGTVFSTSFYIFKSGFDLQ